MSEEDILKYLAKPNPKKVVPVPPTRRVARRPAAPAEPEAFKNFSATHLFCPTCQRAMPVKEKLLLFLGDGDLYDYCCTRCGTSTGTRKASR